MNTPNALVLTLAGTLVLPTVLAYTCNPNIRRSAPNERYVINEQQGTVLDKQTGLMWKRCVERDQYNNEASCYYGYPDYTSYTNWSYAMRRAEASTFAGYQNWRLPNLKELQSLVEVCSGTVNRSVFNYDPNVWVWSSSPYARSDYNYSWLVSFDKGVSGIAHRNSYVQKNYGAVRLVRDVE